MDKNTFSTKAAQSTVLADYLDSLSADSSQERAVVLEVLFAIAAHALYLWLRNLLDHQRGMTEAALREKLEAEVATFVNMGMSHKDAVSAVLKISKQMALKPPSEDVLKTGLDVIKAT